MLPIGTLIYRAADYVASGVLVVVEDRWMQCTGATISRSVYAPLFNYLNSLTPPLPFGVGDGVTSFTIPDMIGRVPVAEGEHVDVDAMGDSEGASIANRRPRHFHYVRLNLNANTAGGGSNAGSPDANSVTTAEGAANNIDGTPAYLVAGSWFIKFTL